MSAFARRLAEAVEGTPLAERLPAAAAPLVSRRGGDAAVSRLSGAPLRGLARAVASQPETASFLSHRPDLLERIADAGSDTLARTAAHLEAAPPESDTDLESALDALRVRRREETCLAACLDLGGAVPFPELSDFLSVLAETITRSALALARSTSRSRAELDFAVLGMGKIAGREFTYHSDLDLIFLYEGDAQAIDDASRVGQRLISYLTTMTGAGVAYAVDTRLRPSGSQGMLVTTLEAFERYQLESAQTWEHIAMLRSRVIAGDRRRAQPVVDRIHAHLLGAEPDPWPYIADMRKRVEQERADESERAVPLKTGRGGLMDVDFLASGALLQGAAAGFPEWPSVPAMLRAAADGPALAPLLDDYLLLRRVESRARWVTGRAVEELRTDPELLALVGALLDPVSAPDALLDALGAARRRIRAAYDRVIESGSIRALQQPG